MHDSVGNETSVRRWCQTFMKEEQNVHDEKSGRPSLITDDPTQSVGHPPYSPD